MIESVNNDKIKEYSKLNDKKYRDLSDEFIVEGSHLVEEARKRDIIVEIFSLDDVDGATKVSYNVMKKLSNLSTPPNILAVCKKLEEKKPFGNILILDDVQNPLNLGTIIRSSVAFGIDTIIASTNTVDVYNDKVIRGSEGMIFNINYIKADLAKIIPSLSEYTIYTTNVTTGESLDKINIDKPYAIIVGNEGAGVSDEVASYATNTIYIPMNDKCESLNVSIATSIILYEFSRK
ncbi:MAG TPA: RNA methyltransferase [Bacilli bacterium]|jgi:TrmH family RNA methyltransferase|nr:RNA methyltransferase [Bacilli bacterium]HPZ23539.1 RNA methyltransferase [Bacilli bacterium]HQC83426.1 RNA methyltransferase [Bacilli bacterium]